MASPIERDVLRHRAGGWQTKKKSLLATDQARAKNDLAEYRYRRKPGVSGATPFPIQSDLFDHSSHLSLRGSEARVEGCGALGQAGGEAMDRLAPERSVFSERGLAPALRKSRGVIPLSALKTRLKWDGCEKPQAQAISALFMSDSRRRCRA